MSGDQDPIPPARFASINVLDALSTAQHMPVEAIELALRAPGRIAEPVLALAAKAADGGSLTEREGNLLFWGIHVLGHAREQRLFDPLLRLLRRADDDMLDLLGDAISGTLARIVVSTFAGDLAPLRDVVADRAADGYVRWSLLNALAYLTFAGVVAREEAGDLLRRFDDERWAAGGDPAWIGWEEAIALAGLPDLAPRVAAARLDARLLDDVSDPEWFALVLADAVANPRSRVRFDDKDLGPVEDVLGELERALASDEEAERPEPVQNPFRDVGRNDPCPCGSGRKFKKCCLAE